MRFAVRVKPNARRTAVGGSRTGQHGEALLVAVTAPAVDGKANDAVVQALTTAFGVRRRQVRIVTGARGRDKLVELEPAPDDAPRTLARLRAGRIA